MARIAVAVPWIALAIFIVAVGGIPFALAMIGFSAIGLSELFRMTRRYRPMVPVAFAAAAGMVVAAYYGTQFQIVLVILAAFPVMFAYALRRDRWTGVTHSMAVTVFGIAWIGLPFAHAVLLRELPDHGGALVIDVLVGTFLTDTAAYAGGRLFGRRKLAPALSPNKTLEGLAFGLAGGTMGFWFAGLYQDWLSGVDALIMGISHRGLRRGGRPVRVDGQARPKDQGLWQRLRAPRRSAGSPRCAPVHDCRGVLPGRGSRVLSRARRGWQRLARSGAT